MCSFCVRVACACVCAWWEQGCPAFGGHAAADRELERTRGDVVERRVKRDALERCLKTLRAAETRAADDGSLRTAL